MGKEVERLAEMIGGTVLYGMVAAERQIFEREIERNSRRHEAARMSSGAEGSTGARFVSAVEAIRDLVRQDSVAGRPQVSN